MYALMNYILFISNESHFYIILGRILGGLQNGKYAWMNYPMPHRTLTWATILIWLRSMAFGSTFPVIRTAQTNCSP